MNKNGESEQVQQYRLYSDLAYLWPIISPPDEYAREAGYWRRVLWDKLGPGKHCVLELGVGGGHNLSHLTRDFQAAAVDLSPQMLCLSVKLNPKVEHFLGDMRSIRLGKTFDAVLIHDAIAHILNESDLRATFITARIHLRLGGVIIVAPEWVKEGFRSPRVFRWDRDAGNIAVTIEEYLHDPDPSDTQVESIFSYTIKENGTQRVEQDTHTTGLFPIGTWERLLAEAGFDVGTLRLPVNKGGYGGFLFVGVLPAREGDHGGSK